MHEPAREVPRLHQLHERREHGRHRLSCPPGKRNRRREGKAISTDHWAHTRRKRNREQGQGVKALRTSRQQRGEQERVGRQRVEPRPGRPPPLALASRRKARLLLLGARRLNPRRWQCPAAGRWRWRERPPEGGARPEEKRARHRRGRHGHHPSCTLPTGYRPVTISWSLGPGGGEMPNDAEG